MAFSRLTLAQLKTFYESELSVQFGINTPLLRNTVVKVLAYVWAAADYMLYGFLDWISKQVMPDTAETEYLDRWAAIWGITRKAAVYAAGDVVFTGTNGTVIPAGTVVVRDDDEEFTTDSLLTIAGGTATGAVTASTAGAAANTDAATILSLFTPISGIDSDVTVDTGGLAGGADQESDALLRGRELARIQTTPQGGTEADFENWVLEVSAVTRAWIFENYLGIGNVGVTFVLDGSVPIIPNAAKLTEVEDYLDARRPITANLTVFAPTEKDLNMTIKLLPNTATVQVAVEAELEDLLTREAEPGGTIKLSHLDEAISIATGETDHVIVTPTADVTHNVGELPVLGTITWQDL